ncbi:MAG: translocation/assembly module TamB domain-containing protein [Spirochaetales bacterium]|nr:translocation/assembly module TamB domain-containing protein [Spirochaetales bacterium]
MIIYFIRILFLLIIFAILALLLVFINGKLTEQMDLLKGAIISYLEQEWGQKIHYNRISPSLLNAFEINQLILYDESNPEGYLRFEKFIIRYNIFRLLLDSDVIHAVSEINFSGTRLFFDFDQPLDPGFNSMIMDLLDRLSNTPYSFKVSTSQISINGIFQGNQLQMRDIAFDIAIKDDNFQIELKRGSARVDFPEYDDFWISTRFRLNGFIPKDLSWVDFNLALADFSSSLMSLNEQSFQFTFRDKQLKIRKVADKSPLNLDFTYDLLKQSLNVIFETEDYRPLDTISFQGSISDIDINDFLDSSITSKGNLEYHITSGELKYQLDALFTLRHPLLPPDVLVSFSAKGDEQSIAFDPLVIDSNIGKIDFVGNILYANLFPEGLLNIVDLKGLAADKNIDATILINRESGSVNLRGQKLYLGTSGFDQFDLDLYPRSQGIFYDMKASLAFPGIDDSILANGLFRLDEKSYLTLNCQLSDVPAALLYKLLSPRNQYSESIWEFADSYFLNSTINLETDFENFIIDTPQFNLTDYEDKTNYLDLSLQGDQEGITIKPVSIQYESYWYKGLVEIQLDTWDKISFKTDFVINDVPYEFEGDFIKNKLLHISGDYGLSLNMDFQGQKRFTFRAKAGDFPVVIPDIQGAKMNIAFEASGFFENLKSWEVTVPKISLENGIFFNSKSNYLDLSFFLNQREFILSKIDYKDEFSSVQGKGRTDWNLEKFELSEISFLLENQGTKEKYYLSGNYLENQFDLDFEFSSAPLRRYISPVLSGIAQGRVEIAGSVQSPEWTMSANFLKAKINTDTFDFSANISFFEGELAFDNLTIGYLEHYLQGGTGRFSLNEKDFTLKTLYSTQFFGRSVEAEVGVSGLFLPYGEKEGLNLLTDDFTSRILFDNFTFGNEPQKPWNVYFSRSDEVYLISGGPDNVFKGKISPEGELRISLSSPFPLTTEISGNIYNKVIAPGQESVWIDAEMANINIDLAALSPMIFDKDVLEFRNGKVSGKNILINGLISDPDYTGQVTVENAAFISFFSTSLFKGVNSAIVFDEKQIRFDQRQFSVENTNVTWVGQLELSHWIPSSYRFEFDISGSYGLDTYLDLGSIVIDGYALGNINISGNESQIRIDGEVTANYCALTLSDDQSQNEAEEQGGAELVVDMNFISGRKLEFLWPSRTIPVLTCFAEQNSSVHILYESNRDFLDLRGNTALQGGQIFFFNRNFFIENGNINFDMLETGRFDPRISLRARIREIDEKGEDVSIFLIADNQFLNDFNPRFESDPSKSEVEIYLIMGRAIQEQFQQGGVSLVLLSSELLSEFGFFRPLEEAIRQTFNLDIFSIRTQVVENILKDKVIGSDEGKDQEQKPATLGEYLDNTTIYIGQYFGKDLMIMGIVRLKETDYDAAGNAQGLDLFGVKPELELTLEWPTPFFNLEWSFKPTDEHVNDLHILDNSISLEWNYSY